MVQSFDGYLVMVEQGLKETRIDPRLFRRHARTYIFHALALLEMPSPSVVQLVERILAEVDRMVGYKEATSSDLRENLIRTVGILREEMYACG